MTPRFLTINEACRAYGLGRTTIYKLIEAHLLKKHRPPGVRRSLLSVDELDALFRGGGASQ